LNKPARHLRQLVVPPLLALLIAACESKPAAGDGQYCNQSIAVLDQLENGPPFTSKDWGNLAVATSKLVYVMEECGSRVTGEKTALCADMRAALKTYEASEKVPRGANRDTAISRSYGIYQQMECDPPLD
jgi:hypothetical protein